MQEPHASKDAPSPVSERPCAVVRLPPQPTRSKSPRQRRRRSSPTENRGQRLLIVEDDADLREALKLRLEHHGYTVSVAADGVSAHWNLLTHRYDAVILDLGLPHRGGLDVMVDLADKVSLPPVLVLTGADEGERWRAKKLGADEVLQKPCSFALIRQALNSMLGV